MAAEMFAAFAAGGVTGGVGRGGGGSPREAVGGAGGFGQPGRKRFKGARLVQILVVVGGLHGLEVDAADDWTKKPAQGKTVREALGSFNEAMRGLTKGKVDLKVAVPGTLAGLGLGMLLAGKRAAPAWYDLVFWSFVT